MVYSLKLFQLQPLKILICRVIELRVASGVVGVAFRDADDHALAGTGEEDAVGVELVGAAFGLVDVLPTVAAEVEVLPAVVFGVVAEVAVPDEAGPVEFEALDVEFGGDVFEEERGADVRDGVQEPRDDVGLGANVDGQGLEAEGLRGDEHAVAFRATGVGAEPLFGLVEVAR